MFNTKIIANDIATTYNTSAVSSATVVAYRIGDMAVVSGVFTLKNSGNDMILAGINATCKKYMTFPVVVGSDGIGFGYTTADSGDLKFTLPSGAGKTCRFFACASIK